MSRQISEVSRHMGLIRKSIGSRMIGQRYLVRLNIPQGTIKPQEPNVASRFYADFSGGPTLHAAQPNARHLSDFGNVGCDEQSSCDRMQRHISEQSHKSRFHLRFVPEQCSQFRTFVHGKPTIRKR